MERSGIVMSESFDKFRNILQRVTDDVRAGRREPQEKLSHNIAKRWRIDETRARMGSGYFEFLNTRRETGVERSSDRKAQITGFSMYFW